MADPSPHIHDTHQSRWPNVHQTYTVPIRRLLDVWNAKPDTSSISGYRGTTAGLQGLIAESLGLNERIRAFGGGWSLSRAPVTDGTLINTKPLTYKFPLLPTAIRNAYSGNRENLYFFQCGNSISGLNHYLSGKGKSLRTTGASNGQTIAGAIATGTHGSAIDAGSVSDFVVAIHLVVSPTRHVWLERASNPVLRDASLPKLIGAEIIRDDAIFNAALVSFGSFGIVHGVVIEVEDQYFLNVYRKSLTLTKKLRAAFEDLDFIRLNLDDRGDERPYHFQVVINPFLPKKVFVTTMFRDAAMPPGSKLPDPPSAITQGDDAFGIIGSLTDISPLLTPLLGSVLFKVLYKERHNVAGTPGQIFRDTSTTGKAAGTAMGIPLSRVNEALDALMDLHKNDPDPAPILFALRYVRSTQATLGFTYHGERTCVLDIDGPRSSRVRTMFQRSWALLRSLNIPFTLHWGKQNDLNANNVRTAYGDARVDAWLAARRRLLDTPQLRHAFSNDMLVRTNLHQ